MDPIRAIEDTTDEDIRSMPDVEDEIFKIAPDLNPLEQDLKFQSEKKAQAEQAQAAAIEQEKAKKADPANWTLKQTQDHFKENPPKNPQEEASSNALIQKKKEQVNQIKDVILGKEPKIDFNEPPKHKNIFSTIGNKIQKTLGDMSIIESPEFNAIKQQHINLIAKKFNLDPEEVSKNYEAYLFNPQYSQVNTNLLERATGLPGKGGGPLQNTEAVINAIMTPAVVAGLVTATVPTLAGLAVFTGINKIDDWVGLGKELDESGLTDEAKAGFRILRLVSEGGASGKLTPEVLAKVPELNRMSDVLHGLIGKKLSSEKGTLELPGGEQKTPSEEIRTLPEVKQPSPQEVDAFDNKVKEELAKANEGKKISSDEQDAQDFVLNNPKQARENYINQSIKEFKSDNVISADIGKFAVPEMSAEKSFSYHETGSALTKAREAELLANPETRDLPVAMTAGGSGSGKSNLLRELVQQNGKSLQDDFTLINDTNLNNYDSAKGKIEKYLKSRPGVDIVYVYRDPLKAWSEGVIPRVKTQDRIVPIAEHIKTHRDSLPTVKKLMEDYKDDSRVNFQVMDNTGLKGESKSISIDKVPKFDYTGIEDKLYDLTKKALDDGQITKEQFRTALEGSPKLQERYLEESKNLSGEITRSSGLPPSEQPPASGLTPQVETDPAKIQEIKNSIAEGEMILKSGKTISGRKMSSGELDMVKRSIENSKARIGNEKKLPEEKTPPTKRRKFITTVKEAEKTAPEVAQKIESRYTPISNEETLKQAKDFVAKDYNAAVDMVMGPARADTLHNAVAITLIDKAQAEGRFADAISLVERAAEKQTELGQAIQSLSMYERLTPEGILQLAQKTVRKARGEIKQKERLTNFDKLSKDLKDPEKSKLAEKLGIPHISEILVSELRRMSEQIQTMPPGREKQIQTALLLKKITDLIPKDLSSKISMVQTMAQLLNPKTFVRNLLGNIGFQLTENISDTLASALDIATSLRTGKRTVYIPHIPTQIKGLAQGLKEGTEEAILGVNIKTGEASKFTLPRNGVFDKGVMGALEKTMRVSLGATDRAFYQSAFNQSLRDQMSFAKSKGVELKEPTEEMIEKAHLLGLYRTFQDENAISRWFVNAKRLLNAGGKWGFGDIALKYPKTPANILARGLEYSPFGLLKTASKVAKPLMGYGEFDQEGFVRSLSRSLTGSALMVGFGAFMASMGIISGKRTKDKDVAATREDVGLREYQINASALKRFVMSGFDPEQAKLKEGDVHYTYDWFLPNAIGVALGANMFLEPHQNATDKIINMGDRMLQASETLQEQPLVQGLKTLTSRQNIGEGISEAIKGIPASFVPTLLNQVRQLMDNTVRNTKDPNYFKEVYNKTIMRVPGLSGMLPARQTPLGQEKQMYQLGSNNPFNVFLNPAFVNKYKPDPVSKMVLDIWETTGQTIQFPRVAQTKIKLTGSPEPIELTPEQYTEFQKYIGNKTDVLFTILSDKPGFMALPDEIKAKKLQSFLTDINTAAKIEILGYRPKHVPSDVLIMMKAIGESHRQVQKNEEDSIRMSSEEDIRTAP